MPTLPHGCSHMIPIPNKSSSSRQPHIWSTVRCLTAYICACVPLVTLFISSEKCLCVRDCSAADALMKHDTGRSGQDGLCSVCDVMWRITPPSAQIYGICATNASWESLPHWRYMRNTNTGKPDMQTWTVRRLNLFLRIKTKCFHRVFVNGNKGKRCCILWGYT